ncbi:DUF4342 domain-containing protein [Umezawaea endophytica]|uniref:DUF4342 domain-containing protein n=1 Tax=Umezawaea endophytica TaxID=1654476 RepID=A0A9X2VFJ7_9PSEU|nr:DUF4342 domain-containing protein [Umezawaea endophytica]MCS7475224.1 DUF4342 domain-containing protein [Umezawaea endophytica]
MTVTNNRTTTTSERVRGHALVAKVKELIHEGNVRRIVVKDDHGHTIVEIPVTAGVVAAIAAPVVTAVAAIAVLAKEWSIEVERVKPPIVTGPEQRSPEEEG